MDNNNFDDSKSTRTSSSMSGETTVYSSMDGTPAPSLYSYHSSDGTAMLRDVAGRVLNAKNDLYLLPADEGEHSRLDKQHLVNLLAMGRLYIAEHEVQEALAPTTERTKMVLDLGTGGGNWAIGMALEFPHSQVIGVDLAPSTLRPPPPNCRFEFDDFTLGLEHYYSTFDVVHSRSVANGVKDFEWFINEAAKCVRPGGVLLITEGNLEMQNENKVGIEPAFGEGGPGQSWLARACFEAYNSMKLRGSAVDSGTLLERWFRACPEVEDVKYTEIYVPIGPWERGRTPEETQKKELIGTLMRQNMKEFVRSCRPMLTTSGYPPTLLDRFVRETDRELDELKLHMYVKWHHACGRRIAAPEQSFSDYENDNDVDMS
ncbi:S-adenosyl-L-methionine-dependent methyltransferase [Schizopora paradoxa]|uniref:S-adenosyl-L-methionine-dependent methyltransferase n=1 Tax=Schizopora paradoxa TaxID=27342 RepID=A0A0H2RS44_9AGAM|nr:S-adenosyl-L-methionine-dependent methyltransferase [Schizopora paradoxa]